MNINLISKKIAVLGVAAVPLVGFAQVADTVEGFLFYVMGLVNDRIIPLLIMLALIYVLWTGLSYIRSLDDSQRRDDLKKQLFWGIIGLFVIVSIWSLVALIGNTFDIWGGGTLSG